MRNTILEHIIKVILLENRIVAKIIDRPLNKKIYLQMKADGAVHVFSVIVKGTSAGSEIINAAQRAISKSISNNSLKISVGTESEYANGEYVYIISDPVQSNKQILVVGIFKNTGILTKDQYKKSENQNQDGKDDKDVNFSDEDPLSNRTQDVRDVKVISPIKTVYINQSPMITVSNYEKAVKQLNIKSVNISTLKTVGKEIISSAKLEYPYKWIRKYDDETIKATIYTLSGTNSIYYNDSKGDWYSLDQKEFEMNRDKLNTTDFKKVEDDDIFDRLEDKYPYPVQLQIIKKEPDPQETPKEKSKEKSKEKPKPQEEKPKPQEEKPKPQEEKPKPQPKPTTPTLKKGDVLQFANSAGTAMPLYWYKDGKMIRVTINNKTQDWTITADWKTNKQEQLTYGTKIIISNKTYYYVTDSKKTGYWIESKYFLKTKL